MVQHETQPPPAAVITAEDDLRAILGFPSARAEGKKLAQLEPAARLFISRAPFACVLGRGKDGLMSLAAMGGPPGFVQVEDDATLRFADPPPDLKAAVAANPFAALILMIPGVNETLRVNGRADLASFRRADGGAAEDIRLSVEEQYLHCPKAFVRSALWQSPEDSGLSWAAPEPGAAVLGSLDAACRSFIERAPFAFLGTSLVDGQADVSPRGDPAGFVKVLDGHTLLLPDRPGNRLADSFRNIIANPVAGLLFLIPGQALVLRLRARAQIVTEAALLAPLAVQGKTPRLGIRLEVLEASLERSPAIEAAGLWDVQARQPRSTFPTIGELLALQLNPECSPDGVQAERVDADLRRDAEVNLY